MKHDYLCLGGMPPSKPGKECFTVRVVEESMDIPPAKKEIRRTISPPPIWALPGQYESDDGGSPIMVAKLNRTVKKLQAENKQLRERDAERAVELVQMRSDFDKLTLGLTSKMRRDFNEMGKLDLYYAGPPLGFE